MKAIYEVVKLENELITTSGTGGVGGDDGEGDMD